MGVHYYTGDDRPMLQDEVHPDEGKVERDGYMTTEQIVNELLEAGEALVAFREAVYASEADVAEEDMPVTRMNSTDALYLSKELEKKIERDTVQLKKEVDELKKKNDKEKENKGKEEGNGV